VTAQLPEHLHYEGQVHSMCTEPLGGYFSLLEVEPPFQWTNTGLWRGYVGTWEILEGRLYLIKLKGLMKGGAQATVASVFPDFPTRVFAHWYSGVLRVPQGQLLNYVHMGYGNTFEEDLLIEVECGVVQGTSIRKNNLDTDSASAFDGIPITSLPGGKE